MTQDPVTPGSARDKRAGPRISTDFVIELSLGEPPLLVGIAKLIDLSVTGVMIETTTRLAKEESYRLRFLLKKKDLLHLPAHTVWEKKYPHVVHYGMQFIDLSPVDQAAIQKFVLEQMPPQDFVFRLQP